MSITHTKIDPKTFAENRAHAYEYVKALGGIAVLQGNGIVSRNNSDYEGIFRQDGCFYYLSGVNEPDAYIVWNLVDKSFHVFLTCLSEADKTWTIVDSLEDKKKFYNADTINDISELPTFINKLIKEKNIGILHTLEFTCPCTLRKALELSELFPIDRTNLQYYLGEARTIKTNSEIEVLRRSCSIATQSHIESMKRIRVGILENDLDAYYHYFSRKLGGVKCKLQGFYPIASFGVNTATLHYAAGMVNDGDDFVAKDGDLAMLDAGIEYSVYTSDITRTFPINGKFSERQKGIYNIVLAAHDAIFDAIKPGVKTEDIHRLSMRIIGEGLLKLGFFKGVNNVEELIEKDLVALFYPHGFGHMMGIEVHDVNGYPRNVERINKPGLRSLRCRRELKVNMVTTDEPGIYFNPVTFNNAFNNPEVAKYLNVDLIKSYLDFGGIRIEDDVLVTPTGAEYLTSVPRTVADIEALIEQGKKQLGDSYSGI